MSLVACIRCWPCDDALAVVGVAGSVPTNVLEHRRLRPPWPAGTAGRCRRGRTAAAIHARVPTLPTPTTLRATSDEAELLEQVAPVALQRSPVAAQQRPQPRPSARRGRTPSTSSSIGTISGGSLMIRRSPSTTWVSLASACMLSCVRALATFASARLRTAARACGRCSCFEHVVDVEVGVPDVEVRHRGELAHRRRGTRASTLEQRSAVRSLAREAVVATGDREAGGEALHVPLPRPGQRLVEVVDVEHEPALGRAEARRSSSRWASPQSCDVEPGARGARRGRRP